MKKLPIIILLVILSSGFLSAKVLHFTAVDSASNPLTIDSIKIKNAYLGLDTTIFGKKFELIYDGVQNFGIVPQFSVSECFPNPFEYLTTVKISVSNSDNITIKIFDIQGKLIIDFHDYFIAGSHLVHINLGNVIRGVYFVEISDGINKITKKLLKFSVPSNSSSGIDITSINENKIIDTLLVNYNFTITCYSRGYYSDSIITNITDLKDSNVFKLRKIFNNWKFSKGIVDIYFSKFHINHYSYVWGGNATGYIGSSYNDTLKFRINNDFYNDSLTQGDTIIFYDYKTNVHKNKTFSIILNTFSQSFENIYINYDCDTILIPSEAAETIKYQIKLNKMNFTVDSNKIFYSIIRGTQLQLNLDTISYKNEKLTGSSTSHPNYYENTLLNIIDFDDNSYISIKLIP